MQCIIIITVAATQRPSADIIPTSLRDLFGYRVAFRCTTDSSSDIILSVGWAKEGYSAKTIDPTAVGVGWLLAEGGTPSRFKAAYLTDADIRAIVAVSRDLRAAAYLKRYEFTKSHHTANRKACLFAKQEECAS